MSSRKHLIFGRRVVVVLLAALPISACTSVGVATFPFASRDVAFTIGFFLFAPVWVACACTLFCAERSTRVGVAWLLGSVALCALGKVL